MSGILQIDGLFYKIGSIALDLIKMSVLWLVFTIIGLGITFFPATVAVFQTMDNGIKGGNCSFKVFKQSFLDNLSTGIGISLAYIFGSGIIIFNLLHFEQLSQFFPVVILWIIVVISIFILIEGVFIFPYIIKNMKVQETISSILVKSIQDSIKALMVSLTSFMLTVVWLIGGLYNPVFVTLFVSIYCLMLAMMFKHLEIKRSHYE